jgi:hypothetical protein
MPLLLSLQAFLFCCTARNSFLEHSSTVSFRLFQFINRSYSAHPLDICARDGAIRRPLRMQGSTTYRTTVIIVYPHNKTTHTHSSSVITIEGHALPLLSADILTFVQEELLYDIRPLIATQTYIPSNVFSRVRGRRD